MIRDGMFESSDVTTDNISKISLKQCELEELRMCELSELADCAVRFALAMLSEGYGIYEILSIISEGFYNTVFSPAPDSIADNIKGLVSYLKMTSAYDKTVFSKFLLDRMRKAGVSVTEKSFLSTDTGNGVFTYVKNSLADEAYDVFSQEFMNPRLKYSSSFNEAVGLLKSGECEYSLLPLEEKGGARLFSVASLLFADDLKINSVTPVFGYEGTADMKYALVSKHFTVPDVMPDDDRYLEIRLRKDSSVPIAELLSSADAMDVSIYRVNTVSFNTDEGQEQFYSIVFCGEGRDFSDFLVYLTLFSGAYTVVGIYKNLE